MYIAVIAIAIGSACSRDPNVASHAYLARGDRFMAREKYRDASIEYRNALKFAPHSIEAHRKLAEAAERANDPNIAALAYLQIAALDPQDVAAQVRAASIYVLAGRCRDARERAEAALKTAADARAFLVLGEALGCLQDRTRSLAALKEAVRLAPASAESRVALASAYWADNRPRDAEAELERAVAASPDDVRSKRALALLLMATGRETTAEPLWKVVAAANDVDRLALADYYLATNRLADADSELTDRLASFPEDDPARLRLAAVQFAAGNPNAAFASIETILRRDSRHVPARILRAQLLGSSRRFDEALADVRSAVAADPMSAQAHLVEGDLLNATGQSADAVKAFEAMARVSSGDQTPYLRIATIHLARGRSSDAVAAADRARAAAGNTPAVALVLIDALGRARQFDRAEQEARAAIAAWPGLAAFQAKLGGILLATGRPDEARRTFDAVLELAPNAAEGIAGLTVLDLHRHRPREAERRIDAALRQRPGDAALLLLSAQTSVAIGDYARAEATLKQLIAADSANFDAFSTLGALYLRENRLAQAREQFTVAAADAPTPAASTMVGMILEAEGRRDAAKRQYEQTLAHFPRAAIAANNLAWIYLDEGRLEEALRWSTVAHEELPGRAEVADTLGFVYGRRGDWSHALPWLADAADLNPKNPTYHYHLATAYLATGQRPSAAKELARAVESPTPFVGREHAVSLLNALGKPAGTAISPAESHRAAVR